MTNSGTDSGRSGWGVIVTLALVVGLVTVAFWTGLEYRNWVSPNSWGYVGIDPVRRFDPLHYDPKSEYTDWSGLKIEQSTQAAMLTSDTLFASALSNSDDLRKTAWFKSFRNPIDARRWLADHFHADPVVDSKLIKVYVTGVSDSREAKRIIEDIVNTHLDQQRTLQTSKVLDRTAQLNNLKSKQELRIHDLVERQNNLMMRLNLGQVGSPTRYTAIDAEFSHAIDKHLQLQSDLAAQQVRVDALKKLNRPDDPEQQLHLEELQASYTANAKNLEQLKGQLGEMAISMSEYLSTVDELTATGSAYKEIKDQLDTLASQAAEAQIDWKQRPEASDSE